MTFRARDRYDLLNMNLPKSLTTVTLLSKIIAGILFIILPFLGFWLGREYQKSMSSDGLSKTVLFTTDQSIDHELERKKKIQPPEYTSNGFYKIKSMSEFTSRYEDQVYNFSFEFPSDMKLNVQDWNTSRSIFIKKPILYNDPPDEYDVRPYNVGVDISISKKSV